MKTKLIFLEGIDGSGKTTMSNVLANALEGCGISVYQTSEPYGTDFGLKAHEFVKSFQQHFPHKPESNGGYVANIYWKAMIVNFLQNIIPAIESGKTVICDRSYISTLIYQFVNFHIVKNLNNKIYPEYHNLNTILEILKKEWNPQYFLIDITPKIAFSRLQERRGKDDTQTLADLQRLSEHYKRYFTEPFTNKKSHHIIDGNVKQILSEII